MARVEPRDGQCRACGGSRTSARTSRTTRSRSSRWRISSRGIKSKVFLNAPAGLLYPGDEGFPPGQTGLNIQWWNLSPRAGRGVGRPRRWPLGRAVVVLHGVRLHVRRVPQHQLVGAPPFGNRSTLDDPPGLMDDPYRHGRRRSPSDRDRAEHAVRAVRRLRHDGSRASTRRGSSRGT